MASISGPHNGPTPKENMLKVKVEKDASKSMPPPPDPMVPPPAPNPILSAEIDGLSTCLKGAAVKTGQIYGFYADTRKLGIDKHAPNPPRSLTASLGRELEKYDQICDSIEAYLLRAISVLQRDLHREERRLEEVEKASVATRTRSKSVSLSPTSTRSALPAVSDVDSSQINTAHPTPTNSPPAPNSAVGPGRRPSAISISSLHRPAFPLKLDLSSTSLRITPEETSMFSTGLASPVTLAPKSARPVGPSEFPPELMAAFASSDAVLDTHVDIDLTVPDTDQDTAKTHVDGNVGNSADKPIELDLDSMDIDMAMTDLFGDAPDSNSADVTSTDGLFSPVAGDTNMLNDSTVKQEDTASRSFLETLGPSNEEDIFATLAAQAASSQNLPEKAISSLPSSSSAEALIASFSSSQLQNVTSSSGNSNISGGEAQFDLNSLDLSPGFFGNGSESTMGFSMDMEDFLNMGATDEKEVPRQEPT